MRKIVALSSGLVDKTLRVHIHPFLFGLVGKITSCSLVINKDFVNLSGDLARECVKKRGAPVYWRSHGLLLGQLIGYRR